MNQDANLRDQCDLQTEKARELMDLLARMIVSQEYFGRVPLTRKEIPDAVKRIEARVTHVYGLMQAFIKSRVTLPNENADPHEFTDATLKVAGAICEFAARSLGRGLGK